MSQDAAYEKKTHWVNLTNWKEILCEWSTKNIFETFPSLSHNLTSAFPFQGILSLHPWPLSCYSPPKVLLQPTPVSRLGSEQAPWRQQLPCVSAWRSWFVGTQSVGVASEAEPPESCWGWPPQGSLEPAEGRRSHWEVACVYAMECLQCCSQEVPVACWLLRVAAGRRWWLSCLKLMWGSTGSGSLAGGGLWVEDWWLWRTVCHSWIKCLSRCYSLPMTRALVPERLPYGRERRGETKTDN